MENLHIEGSKGVYYIPTINFDASTGVLEITGESFLEDTEKFYTPAYEWLRTFTEQTDKEIRLNIGLSYYNTSSSRAILTILKIIREFKLKGGTVDIYWYLTEDKDIVEEIDDFKIESELEINLVYPKKD